MESLIQFSNFDQKRKGYDRGDSDGVSARGGVVDRSIQAIKQQLAHHDTRTQARVGPTEDRSVQPELQSNE